ncbi:decaprenyl-phosphate phosphoribosyltransferase [Reinekea sp. G2M2-21]|uniref:decaprenyl-phosphate phosphoribosyltransferase n=1 Tax=Reinekea sp. G2M2-21 TaxID=2788942 RepID=UPI0018A94718|nr:decaprenyl-phosphate phosphoribosyltransferase [Reinekea sp. G2M2-21]
MLNLNISWFIQAVKLMRLKHWIKNGFVFLPLLFSEQLFLGPAWQSTLLTAFLFCICASSIYVVNDIFDVEKDRNHPVKRMRPIASGKVTKKQAWTIAAFLTVLGIGVSVFVPPTARLIVLAYFLMNVAYSSILKHEVLLDVFIVAIGFVLRVIAGSVSTSWESASWLILVTFFIALFLALGKRRHELLYSDSTNTTLRPVLEKYNEKLLDYLIIISATLTIISYSLFVVLRDPYIFTLPFVIYGMFRYMHLVYTQDSGGDPTDTVSKDKVIIVNVGVWSLIVTGLLIFAN